MRRRGFTLLEMIVATALMSIAVVGLLSLLSGSLANASRARQYDQIAMLARSKMNELLVETPLPVGQPLGGQWDEATGWTALLEPFEAPPNAYPGAVVLVRIDLEVWWKEGAERRSVRLEGFRPETLAPGGQP
jgi:general secretion pathway protein I